jgi:hypothetical protein
MIEQVKILTQKTKYRGVTFNKKILCKIEFFSLRTKPTWAMVVTG